VIDHCEPHGDAKENLKRRLGKCEGCGGWPPKNQPGERENEHGPWIGLRENLQETIDVQ